MSAENRLADYEILREAGRGAMSTVYEAVDRRDGRTVALKVLHAPATLSFPQQQSLIARLGREARLIARLSHPNIVRILDVGEHDGRHFLAMEYLHGTTLRARIDKGPLSLAESSQILDQVAEALDAIHAQKIVHRDIKPSNVMLLPDGVVKLMDFGIARQGDDTTITQTGMIVGSPAYMAPEQIRGEGGAPSSDLWALGVLMYEMLSGRSPWAGNNIPAVLYKVTHETPPPVPGLSPQVQQALRRALEKNPARRYRTAREFAAALRGTWQPAERPRRLPLFRNKRRTLLTVLTAFAVVFAAGGAARLSLRSRSAPPVRVAAIAPAPAPRPFPVAAPPAAIHPMRGHPAATRAARLRARKALRQVQDAAKSRLKYAKAELKAVKHPRPAKQTPAARRQARLSRRHLHRAYLLHSYRPASRANPSVPDEPSHQLEHFIYNY